MTALLQVENLVKHYRLPRERLLGAAPRVRALEGVSFDLQAGRTLGVVGESGSGKSTLARLVMALDTPSAGSVELLGRDLHRLTACELRAARRDLQMVFQDPYGSLDPRQTVETIVTEPLQALANATKAELRERAAEVLAQVGLRAGDAHKYPHEFSGGQRQRIAIARALAVQPELLICDEPTSALDVSVQAQILNLLKKLQEELGVAYLFITHDLTVARAITDDVMVMRDGKIVERGRTGDVLDDPQSDAAKDLVAAAPDLHRAIARRLREQG